MEHIYGVDKRVYAVVYRTWSGMYYTYRCSARNRKEARAIARECMGIKNKDITQVYSGGVGSMSNIKGWIEAQQESLISAGFDRDFIEGLEWEVMCELYLAWDVLSPEEQWENIERFFNEHDIEYDFERIFQ